VNENAGLKLLGVVLGFWLVMRTIRSNSTTHQTLIDQILGQAAGANRRVVGTGVSSAASSAPSTSGPHQVLPAMHQIASGMGWNASEVAAWQGVIAREDASGSLTAKNPTSRAYGIAQFINGPGEYAKYGGNTASAYGELTAMANYIKQRYGTPQAALAHELAYHWY
jgi:hypothetical protein